MMEHGQRAEDPDGEAAGRTTDAPTGEGRATMALRTVPSTATVAEEAASAWLTRQIRHLRAEHAALRERLASVEEELDKRTRRLHQLLGERDQLAALLAGRDAEILRLARELGARDGPAHRPGARPQAWLGSLRAAFPALQRLSRAATWEARTPALAPTPEGEAPEPPLVPWVNDGPPRPVLAAVLLGLAAPEIVRVLEVVERDCGERGMVPLLLLDDDSFRLFRGRRVVVEFLPPRAVQARAAELDWPLYMQRRLALIRRKWQPARIVAFGEVATEVVQLWQESPFEATPIPTPVGRRPADADPV